MRPPAGKKLPDPNRQAANDGIRDYQMFVTAKSIDDFHKANKNVKLNISSQDERELEAALKKSLEESGEGGG
jgi:hypothetical protein